MLDPADVGQYETGLWGGLILLGKAILNSPEAKRNEDGFIEDFHQGITSILGIYGGDDPEDNSGSLQYISIRHSGAELIPFVRGNGLTLGAVGNGTTIDFIEIYASGNDGIEWIGGNCNVKHAIVAFSGDDGFDYDRGANFNGQFWFSIGAEES